MLPDGGIARNFGPNGSSYRIGRGREFVIEGDEYDSAFFDKTAKFLKYLPDIAVINNVEFDHADIYADFDAVALAFRRLVTLIPRRGLLLIGSDSEGARALTEAASSRVETFGMRADADWQAHDLAAEGSVTRFGVRRGGSPFGNVTISQETWDQFNPQPRNLYSFVRTTGGQNDENVAAIEIGMGNVNWLTVGEPYDVTRDSVVHAQFNASYSFARALADGRVDLATYQKPAIGDPRIVALTRITSVISDPAIDATAIEPARVKITLKDGTTRVAAADAIKGSPQEPMTEGELLEKFRGCLEFGLGATRSQADRLAETVLDLEHVLRAAFDGMRDRVAVGGARS